MSPGMQSRELKINWLITIKAVHIWATYVLAGKNTFFFPSLYLLTLLTTLSWHTLLDHPYLPDILSVRMPQNSNFFPSRRAAQGWPQRMLGKTQPPGSGLSQADHPEPPEAVPGKIARAWRVWADSEEGPPTPGTCSPRGLG